MQIKKLTTFPFQNPKTIVLVIILLVAGNTLGCQLAMALQRARLNSDKQSVPPPDPPPSEKSTPNQTAGNDAPVVYSGCDCREQRGAGQGSLAVLDFDAEADLGEGIGRTLADLCRATVQESGAFILLDREDLVSILGEEDFASAVKCDDTKCLVNYGKKLRAQKILFGRVSKLGNSLVLTLKITDVSSAKVDAFHSAGSKVDLEQVGAVVQTKTCDLVQEALAQIP